MANQNAAIVANQSLVLSILTASNAVPEFLMQSLATLRQASLTTIIGFIPIPRSGRLRHKSERKNMRDRVRMTVCIVSGLLLWASCGAIARSVHAQSLDEKLGAVTDYVPKAIAPLDQLVEVARRFNIPMGIEWVERAGTAPVDQTLRSGKRSVRELIQEIASLSPGYRLEVDNGLVRIYSPEALHPFNFLNIRLKNYSVKDEDLFAAEHALRLAIRFTLEPAKYRYGYAGGYGHPANHVFQFPKFTLSESNVTVREVLNAIALAQGNALWIITIKSEDLQGDEPSWTRKGADGGDAPVTSAWHFLPLAEIAQLAKTHVAVDVTIDGLLDERMTTIPVMLERRLKDDSAPGMGGGSSAGSYRYAASIEKLGKDFVTLSVQLNVERPGETDFTFDRKIEIHTDHVTEIRPESRILIRAYFENAAKP